VVAERSVLFLYIDIYIYIIIIEYTSISSRYNVKIIIAERVRINL